jgi:putative heme-binding domain-containing protein
VHGIVLSSADPLIVASMGGATQTIPKGQVESNKSIDRSLMLSAEQLGFKEQDVADLLAYLKAL